MSIILAGIRGVLTRHLVAVLFFDERSLGSGLGDANGALWLVLTRCRVLIGNELVLATHSHVSLVVTEALKVSIVLARVRSIFARDSVSRFLLDDSGLAAR